MWVERVATGRILRVGWLLALGSVACTGQVGAPGAGVDFTGRPAAGPGSGLDPNHAAGQGGAGGAGAAGAGGSMGAADGEPQPAAARLRRLTLEQYRNSVRDLLGLEANTSGLSPVPPLNGLQAIGASSIAVAELDVEGFERLADTLSEAAFSDVAGREKLVGCDASEAACADGFVPRFGRRVFRRPLSGEESDRYVALVHTASAMTGDGWLGLRVLTSALLQSPHFLYRAELGAPDPQNPDVRLLTDYELATRLSFLLWNTTPDPDLLDAADAGALSDPAGLSVQAERLLASPRSAGAMDALFRDYMQLGALDTLVKQPEVFPQMSDTLGSSMARETLWSLRTLGFERGIDFRELFTTTTTFVNPELARLYAIPEPVSGDFEEVQLAADGPRAGLLTQGSFLATHAHPGRTSPTRRGKFIRESLMCQGIAPPPAGVDTTLPDTSQAKTMREKLRVHAENPTCAGCHAIMDPPGLGLENFDAIGAYRSTDHGEIIDASGMLDAVAFSDARGVGEALSANPALTACFVRTLLRVSRGQLENPTENDWVEELDGAFADAGYRMRELLSELVAHPSFRHVGPVQ